MWNSLATSISSLTMDDLLEIIVVQIQQSIIFIKKYVNADSWNSERHITRNAALFNSYDCNIQFLVEMEYTGTSRTFGLHRMGAVPS